MAGRLELDAAARRWVIAVAALAAALVAALPLLSLVYGPDELITVYGIVVVALLCQGAETVDAWRERRDAELGLPPASITASAVMRWVVVALVVYLGFIGLTDMATGLGGGATAGQSGPDLVASGALLTVAGALSLLLFWRGARWVPGLGRLREGRPITWFAIAAVLEAFAQNLAPAAGTQSVASTIARPVTAGDLIVGSLPYGGIALLAVGPVVRRGLLASLRRLGALPVRPGWAALGLATGVLVVPGMDAAFGATEFTVREALLHLGPLAVALAVLGWPRGRHLLLEAIRLPATADDDDGREGETASPPPGGPVLPAQGGLDLLLRVAVLAAAVAVAVDAVGLAVSLLAQQLPSDCLAQQAQVSQSLSGGPTGRAWYGNTGIALAAGIDEELLFRGVIQPRFGLVLTSLLFASFHLQYTCHGLPSVGDIEIVLLGVVFGLLRQRGGLAAAVLCHAAYDASILLNPGR
jgi:membrane protease YdiL (CAAX protease family)